MQNTVKALRLIVPLLFLGFLVLIALTYTSNVKKGRGTAEPVTSAIRANDQAKLIATSFDDTQTLAGKVVSRIRARRTVAFASGWYTLEDVQLTIYRPNGLVYELMCPQAQFKADSKEAEVKGGVTLRSSDGLEIRTAEMKFDGNRLVNQIPVEFKVDSFEGKAGGLDLNIQHESLRLTAGIQARSATQAAGEPPVLLAAEEAIFRRPDHDVRFNRSVTLTREKDVLRADSILATIDRDKRVLRGLEGAGNISLRMVGGSPLGSGGGSLGPGEKQLTAERFTADISPEGKIQAINAVGEQVPAHVLLQGPPRRDITSKVFRVMMQGTVVSELRCEDSVVMQELGPSPRVIQANRVIVRMDPRTRQASSALIEGNMRYKDPKNEAVAERANYDITGDRLVMSALAGSAPSITADGQNLKANLIEISPKEGLLRGSGSVVTKLANKKGAVTASDTGIFPQSASPVYVNSDSVLLRNPTRMAIFSGNVRAWQDDNTLFASELHVTGAGDSIEAKTNVRAVLYNTKGGRTKPMIARSDTLTARKLERRIDMDGNVKIEDETRVLTSDKASFYFDATRKLERIEAQSNLTMVDSASGRRVSGTKAVYQLAEKMVYLNGTPAEVVETRGTIKATQIVVDIARDKVNTIGPAETTYNPQR